MTDLDHLLQAICDPENHADDILRLVYADCLEEQGQQARAEFVRVQVALAKFPPEFGVAGTVLDAINSSGVEFPLKRRRGRPSQNDKDVEILSEQFLNLRRRERQLLKGNGDTWAGSAVVAACHENGFNWEWRRGFVHTIRTTLKQWYGVKCVRCDDTGRLTNDRLPRGWQYCPHCEGKACPSAGRAIVRQQPVEVVKTERRPYYSAPQFNDDKPRWTWFDAAIESAASHLPSDVYALLQGGVRAAMNGVRMDFSTKDVAHAALSAALLQIARREQP